MPLPQRHEPAPDAPRPERHPELVPPPERPDRGRKWWPVAAVILVAAAGLFWQFGEQAGFGGGGGGAAITAIPTATAEPGKLERTIRLSGTTAAEKYATIKSPRLRGSDVTFRTSDPVRIRAGSGVRRWGRPADRAREKGIRGMPQAKAGRHGSSDLDRHPGVLRQRIAKVRRL